MMPSSTIEKIKKSDPYAKSSNELFRKVANVTSRGVGHPWSFVTALMIVIAWGISGPVFHFSDTWQLVINTGTTIVTFLMVFLIQNTQNRDSHAIHLKLDELIYANKRARNRMMDLDELSEDELADLQKEFKRVACDRQNRTRTAHHNGKAKTTSSSRTESSSSRTTSRIGESDR